MGKGKVYCIGRSRERLGPLSLFYKETRGSKVAYTHGLAQVTHPSPPPHRILRDTHYNIDVTQQHAVTCFLYSF